MSGGTGSGNAAGPLRTLVTGANRGLGLAFVERFAGRGDRVFAACRAPDEAAALEEVRARHPAQVVPLAVDVRERADLEAAAREVARDGDGSLDVLVNNAGLSPRGEEFSNLRAEDVLAVLEVNTVAPVIAAQCLRPALRRATRPRVVNISSSMGSLEHKTYGRHYSYASSKAALNMMTRAAAHDLAEEGIIVVSLHPGWVRTDLGGPKAHLSPEESVAGMVGVIDGLRPEQSGSFLTWEGETHPW